MLKQLLIFTLFMLGMAGICHAQDPTTWRNFGALNANEGGITPGTLKLTKYKKNNIRVLTLDTAGIVRDTNITAILDTSIFQLKPNMVDIVDGDPEHYINNAGLALALAEKSPIINSSAGYQLIGSQIALSQPEATREAILDMNNGIITSRFTVDSGNNHQSLRGCVGFMQSLDSGITWQPYKVIFNSPLDDRAIAGTQLAGGTFVNLIAECTAGPTVTQSLGYFTCDASGNNVSSFVEISLPNFFPGTQGGWFGHAQQSNGVWHQIFYKVDTLVVVDIDTTKAKNLQSDAITTRSVFTWPGILEPNMRYLGGSDWLIICRNNITTGDTARRIILKSNDDLQTIQFVGYSPFTSTPKIEQTPVGMYYDSTRDNLMVMAPTRNAFTGGAGGQYDSMYLFMNTKAGALANTGWGNYVNSLPRPNMGQINNYWYPNSLGLSANKILWQYTGSYSVEVSHLYNVFLNYIPAKSNGGIGAKESAGLTARESPTYSGIMDYKSTTNSVNLDNPLASNQVLFSRISTQGFVNISVDSMLTYASTLKPPLDTVLRVDNRAYRGIATTSANATNLFQPVTYAINSAVNTSFTFRHATIPTSGGVLINMEIESFIYGTPSTKAIHKISFYPNTSTSIATTALAAEIDVNGTLASNRVSASISPDGLYCLRILDTNSAWTAGSWIRINNVTTSNTSTQGINTTWQSGWTIVPSTTNVAHTSTREITPKILLNDASALNGANITAATVTPAKLSYTSTRSSVGTLTVAYGNDYTFTGTTSTWTLPAVAAGTTGRQNAIFIKNAGSGTITLNTNASANVLYYTSLTNTLSVLAGEAYIITPDGTQLNVYKCN